MVSGFGIRTGHLWGGGALFYTPPHTHTHGLSSTRTTLRWRRGLAFGAQSVCGARGLDLQGEGSPKYVGVWAESVQGRAWGGGRG